jgi:pyridoxine 5-phosphate synthase
MALLGVNIDHVATLRNARGGIVPDPVGAALMAEANGADGITAHLREDRRHIRDEDMIALKKRIKTRLNMEMANTDEMTRIALDLKPYMVTLVPERRQELTTEGGLDVIGHQNALKTNIQKLNEAGIKVSLFIDADIQQVNASQVVGAGMIEFHTGAYCETFGKQENGKMLQALMNAAAHAVSLGIEVNAGHGLNYENVGPILALPGLNELNIGHSIVSEAVFSGLGPAVRRMKDLIS